LHAALEILMQPSQRNKPAALGTHNSALNRGIFSAALLIALGGIASRALGLGREATIAYLFGRSVAVDAYTAAWQIPSTLYDFLISGAISAALVPVFSAYAEVAPTAGSGEGDDEFWRVGSGVINVALLLLGALTALLLWQAPLVVRLVAQDTQPGLREQTVALVRLMLPAVPLMGLAGLFTALLYARRTFLLPAFVAAAFNAGIIVAALLLHGRLGVASLGVGVLVGALAQVLLQLPGLRDMRYRPLLNLHHPGVRRVLILYGPVALGMGFSLVGIVIDRWLASGLPAALATMRYATTLIQFPLGLVAAAVSMAVLPTLSRQSSAGDQESFRATLAQGLKVVLLLVLPATVGLAALATPVTALLFQRGAFDAADSSITALALLCYLPGLPAAALDQMLLFAFYARKNTLTPNLVQGAAIAIYLLTALPLLWGTQLGFLALVLGNSAQWIGHALLLLALLLPHVSLRGLRLGEALGKTLVASVGMGIVMALIGALMGAATEGTPYRALAQVAAAAVGGALTYVGLCAVLRVEALGFFVGVVRARVGR
jgi:putative peptidoglycan lipid II flippase